MELRHLRYFVAIGEEQHYGRAAESLGIAQPALSRQIQDLEKELGFSLFDRLPRGVKMSAAGKLFLSDARRILLEVEEAKLRARGWLPARRVRCASDLSKRSPGMAWCQTRFVVSGAGSRTRSWSCIPCCRFSKWKPFDPASSTPDLSSAWKSRTEISPGGWSCGAS